MHQGVRRIIRVWAALAAGLLPAFSRVGFADTADSSSTVRVRYAGGDTDFGTLVDGTKFFINKNYTLQQIPAEAVGLTFTRRPYNKSVAVAIDVPAGGVVVLLVDSNQNTVNADRCPELVKHLVDTGWTELGDAVYRIGHGNRYQSVLKKTFTDAIRFRLTGGAWTGIVVAAKDLELDDKKSGGPKKPNKNGDSPSADPVSTLHIDPTPATVAIPGPSTRPVQSQASINALEVYEREHGIMLGQTSEATLTLTGSTTPQLVSVRFVTKIGDQMSLARDEALRYIHLKYPNWYASKAEITFEDKYTAHDGGSIGTAIGTIVLSCIEGFEIDPKAAITGDISANGKVRAIGGVAAKIKGAIAGKMTLVAIPLDNADQLTDAVVYGGPGAVTDIQVMGIATLTDAVATVRADRSPQLNQAISLFAAVQSQLKIRPADVKTKNVQLELQQVLALAPNHLSARELLAFSQGTQPKTLSATASRYYTFLSAGSMVDVLSERAESAGTHSVPSSVVRTGLINLHKLRPLADVNVRPLIDAWCDFISSWNELQENITSAQAVEDRRQALLDEMQKEDTDADMMQKMLKEGM